MSSKPEGWKQDNRRHYEAKVFGKASPGKNSMKPKYSRQKKGTPSKSAMPWLKRIINKRRKGAIGYFYQDQFISLAEGDRIANGILSKSLGAEKVEFSKKERDFSIMLKMPEGEGVDYKFDEDEHRINIADNNVFPHPVHKNPEQWNLIAGSNRRGSQNWGDWGRTPEAQKQADKWEKALKKHIGEKILLTGGGGSGYEIGTLVGVERIVEKDGTIRIQTHLKNLEGEGGIWGHQKQESADPYMGSWQISVTEKMKLTKYKPPKKD